MNKAVFLDRDGVVNNDILEYTWKIKDFRLNPGVKEAMEIWKKKGYKLILITNQGGIAKGLYTKENVNEVHQYMQELLGEKACFDEIYFCPHHDKFESCICRKPDSLMLEKGIAKYNIDTSHSYFIGDSERDQLAGRKAGVNTIRVLPNRSMLENIPLVI
jgi:D-glycero-D-manno-heptose 1,7-bisphosphate phosphatase